MKPLIRFGIDQNVLINVVFVGLIVFAALVAIPNIPVDRYPNIKFGEVEVTTFYPGASPEEVEVLVTKPIEDSIRDMVDLDWVKSSSKSGLSSMRIKFLDDTNYDALYEELRLRVLGVQNRLPAVNGEPLQPDFNSVDVDEWLPVIQVNLISSDPEAPLSKRALTLLGDDLRTRLEEVPGVKRINMLGDSAQQVDLVISPKALERHRLTLDEVIGALQSTGRSLPAGSVDTPFGERLVRVDTRYRDLDDLYGVVVRQDGNGRLVTIGELIDPLESGIVVANDAVRPTVNGLDTVAAKVAKLSTASAPDVKAAVQAAVDDFLLAHADNGVEVVYTEDNTLEISDGMGVLANSLLLSVVLVMALLFFFLGNRGWKLGAVVGALAVGALLVILTVDEGLPRAAAIGLLGVVILLTCRAAVLSVSGIVFAFLGALLIFWLTGYSLNEITLLSFVLVSGIIVDDAIVVLENIQRHREEGKPLLEAVVDGTSEVFWPVVSATLTTMAAFLPMLLMTGTVGDFFSMVPIAVATALAISLVECLIILPLHVVEAEKVLGRDPSLDRSHTHETGELPTTGVLGLVARVYDRLLRFNLRHPIIAIGSASLLFFMAVGVIVWSAVAPTMGYKPILKSEFFPEDLSVLMLRVKAPPGTPLDQTDATVPAISERLDARGRGEIWTVSGLSGLSLDTNYQPEFSNQRGMAMIKLPPRAERTFDQPRAFLRQLRADIESEFELEGWAIELSPAPSGPPVGLPVNVRITGVDEEQIVRLSSDLQAWMESEVVEGGKLAGVIDLGNDRSAVNGVLTFMPDRRRAALNEVSEDQVSRFVASAFDGAFVGDFRRPDGDIPVRVRLPEDLVASHEGFLSVPLVLDPNGRTLSFGDIGQMQSSIEPADLIRRDFQRTVTITGDLSEDSLLSAGTITPIISAWYKERAADYPGATIAFGGEAESTAKSYQSLMIAFLLSVIIIYGILAAQFRSYLQPFLIMSNIVFSFTGVVLFMALMGLGAQYLPAGWIQPERALFTVNSFIAIVGLTGLVINDAIVLIDFINKRRREGMPLEQALITAGHQRMRPIALTTATTIAGLLPMAIGIPEFSITWGPFATSFAAGLAVATVMTLLIVPVLYQTLDRTVSFGRRHLSTVVPALRDDPTSEIERAA